MSDDDTWLEFAWSSSPTFNGFVSRSFLILVGTCGVVQYVSDAEKTQFFFFFPLVVVC